MIYSLQKQPFAIQPQTVRLLGKIIIVVVCMIRKFKIKLNFEEEILCIVTKKTKLKLPCVVSQKSEELTEKRLTNTYELRSWNNRKDMQKIGQGLRKHPILQ